MSVTWAALLGVFLAVFVADVSGWACPLPISSTLCLRATNARTCVSMSTATKSRPRTLKRGSTRKRERVVEWFDEIASEISPENIFSAKDLADEIMSSYFADSPEHVLSEETDVFGAAPFSALRPPPSALHPPITPLLLLPVSPAKPLLCDPPSDRARPARSVPLEAAARESSDRRPAQEAEAVPGGAHALRHGGALRGGA